jgi:hypothetical protein
MNSFNTQLQIDDMNDYYNNSLALLEYCEQLDADRDSQDLRWENIYMDINNEYQDNQPKPW